MKHYDSMGSIPKERRYTIRLEGVNDANPTKELGQGVSVTRTGEGAYEIAWAENPGTFVRWSGPAFGAATPADLKGYTAVRDEYTSDFKLPFVVYNSSFAAADLIADQWIEFEVVFTEAGGVVA